jgi:hypothetical protein
MKALFGAAALVALAVTGCSVPTNPTASITRTVTVTPTPTTRSEQELAAPFNQAFQAVYAKPGETVPRLQDALIDDHNVLKVALPAATTVVSQLQALGIYMALNWSTGEIMEFSASNQHAMDGLNMYLNLKLTPQGFFALGGSIKFDIG